MGAPATTAVAMRPVTRADVPGVIRLYSRVFRREVTAAWYRWKVLDSPRPPEVPAAWIAVDGDRVLAHYGATGLWFRLEGETLPALHGCDLMTAPECRGRGIFGALADTAHREWAAHGMAFIIGLPTSSWGPLRERLGCRTAVPLNRVWMPLRLSAWLPRRWLRHRRATTLRPAPPAARTVGSTMVRPADASDTAFDGVWSTVAPEYDALVARDRRWIEYRYGLRPDAEYSLLIAERERRPVGFLAWRLMRAGGRASGVVADLFAAPTDSPTRFALIEAARAEARANGADDLRAHASPGGPLDADLLRAGFHRRAGGFDAVVIPLARDVPRPLLNEPARWCLAGGDFDVV